MKNRGGGAGLRAHVVDEWNGRGGGAYDGEWLRSEQGGGKRDFRDGVVELIHGLPRDRGTERSGEVTAARDVGFEPVEQGGRGLFQAAAQGIGHAHGRADILLEIPGDEVGKNRAGRLREALSAVPQDSADHEQGHDGQDDSGQHETGFQFHLGQPT